MEKEYYLKDETLDVNYYLKSIGMDDNVDRFMSKIFGDTKRDLQNKSKSK